MSKPCPVCGHPDSNPACYACRLPGGASLAERAVRASGWAWLDCQPRLPDGLPDVESPAGRGCLLELCRRHVGSPGFQTLLRHGGSWIACTGRRYIEAPTEAEVLVAVLEERR